MALIPDTKKRLLRGVVLCAALLAALLLSGCGAESAPAQPEPTAEPSYYVRFYLKDKLLVEDELTQGALPEPVVISRTGLRFDGWLNAVGKPVDPETEPVTGNTAYFASAYPELTRHVPFLFPDDRGFLRPDEPFTLTDFALAVDALAVPEAAQYLPFLPRGDEAITPQRFREALAQMFPEDKVKDQCDILAGKDTVTRAEAAQILCALLGRAADESITLRRGAVLPPDLPSTRRDYAALLEAAVSHTPDEWGENWDECVIPPLYAPGVSFLDGALYCFDDRGIMLFDTEVDGFRFGPDGAYTSGNEELDAIVSGILSGFFAEAPDADRLDYLRMAYDYTRDSFTYLRKAPFTYGQTDWELDAAVEMLTTELGNCYNYAATFWALARGLGYDARAYSGTVGVNRSPHGWVEIEIDGENYHFDTELEMAYRKKGNYSNDMFMMPKNVSLNWSYRRP